MRVRFAEEPSDRLLAALGGRMLTLDDFCRTRLIEVLFHLDDLAASVGLPCPDTSHEGRTIVIDILLGIAHDSARRLGGAPHARPRGAPPAPLCSRCSDNRYFRPTAVADNAAGYVCLSFDFDGPSLWMQRRMTSPTPISRGEFGAVPCPGSWGCSSGGASATFLIPGHTIETYPDECRAIAEAGYEVGIHGYAHELNATMPPDKERWAMGKAFELIEGLRGRRHAATGHRRET